MKPEAYALMAAVLWGITPVIEKVGLKSMNPLVATIVRSMAAVAFLAALGMAVGELRWEPGFKKALPYMISGGILAGGLGLYLYYLGLRSGDPGRIVAVSSTYPLFTFLAALVVLHRRPGLDAVLGAVLVVAGVVLLSRYTV